MSFSKFLAASASLLTLASSHSWLHCSDYDGTINGQDYDESQCNGYIRGWSSIWGATTFSTDRGVNYQSGGPNWCQSDFSSDIESMYDDGYPYATWNYGETVTLVWPAKNHANYECYSNIPDTSMKLYYNPNVDPTTELGGTTITDEWSLLIDWQSDCTAGTDGCGFQNCPDFCSETDDAPCFQKYTVSADDFPDKGFYTLMWYWIFNPGTPYTTCFEVYITGESVDGGDTDTDDDNSGSSSSSSKNKDYVVQVPICYTGQSYDEDTVMSGVESLFPDENWILVDLSEGTDEFNVTLQTSSSDSDIIQSITDAAHEDDHEICDAIVSEYGGTGTCSSCTDVLVYKTSSSNANTESGDSTGSAVIAVVVVLVIVLIIIGAGIGYQKMQEKKYNEQGSEKGMSNHIASNTSSGTMQAQAIRPVTETS